MYETLESRNYDLDLSLAEGLGITIEELDEMPLVVVELLRQSTSKYSPEWEVKRANAIGADAPYTEA